MKRTTEELAVEAVRTVQVCLQAYAEKGNTSYDAFVWRLVTALRGPDNCNEVLKRFLTEPLRAFLAGDYMKAALNVSTPEDVKAHWQQCTPDEQRTIRLTLHYYAAGCGDHFVRHARSALRVCAQANVPGAQEYWHWLRTELAVPGFHDAI